MSKDLRSVRSHDTSAGRRRAFIEREIYTVAARLFTEKGFASTGLGDIAAALGITRPALYYYVKSKEELLARLVEDVTQGRVEEVTRIAADSASSPDVRLTRIAYALAKNRIDDPTRFLLLARAERDLPSELAEVHDKAKRQVFRAVITVVEEGIRSGVFRAQDARVAAHSVLGVCNWVAWWHQPSTPDENEHTAQHVAELAVRMLSAFPGAGSDDRGLSRAIDRLKLEVDRLERSAGRPRGEPLDQPER